MLTITINRTTKGLISLSALCSIFIIARIILKDDMKYSFLLYNLFLAWIPLLLAQVAYKALKQNFLPATYGILFLWLLFFPNAPYIITDLLHLKGYSQNILWFDSLLIFTFAITGLLIGLSSLSIVHQVLEVMLGKIQSWSVVVGSLILLGFGIYLGRYCRLNSWDLLREPIWFAGRVLHQFKNPMAFKLTFTYAFVILGFYVAFRNFGHPQNTELKRA
ncbi:DUF1361 domain-containing protein [Emticicia sp. BO119]|uniref:DUF1361 domain-containing protein n=1 Tax=Emticicia sp. BO119 TaxID=2757768 RepID=UPI0015F00206|nr:DUF1361 domain-containing protein [Emticicia sp. BO119]MBA4850950.1 DUF1361 domain-containing protein [Emticicia sp. BO119]